MKLSDEIAHWLRQDLSYVPKDKTIMICAHSQMFKKHSSFSTRNKNYPVYRDELLKFKNVYRGPGTTTTHISTTTTVRSR